MVHLRKGRLNACAAMSLLWVVCASVQAGEITLSRASSTKQLVLDSRIVDKIDGLCLVPGTVEKEPCNPLFQADKPWENSLNNLYPNVVFDQQAKLFKLWYKCVLVDENVKSKMRLPQIIHKHGWFLCYATSADGVVWEKPELGICEFDGSKNTNAVVQDVPNAGVFKDVHDPDPARRYKMVYDVGVKGLMRVRFSPDGLHWSDPVIPKMLDPTGDTHNNAFWDERWQRYVLITRIYRGQRLVARSQSKDFVHWEDPKVVLKSLPEEGKGRQTYCMPSFPYANVYLGFVMMYNLGTDRTVDCELTWSPDSVKWYRVNPGTPLIPRGPKDSYDAGCIYAQAGRPAIQDDRMLIFYGGSAVVHQGWKRHCLPCLARLRVDGFAGYRPSKAGGSGSLLTRPLCCVGEPLRVSVDAKGGSLRVAVLDAKGFGLDTCEPIVADVTDATVRWKSGKDLSMLKGKMIRLRFELNAATLYAFGGLRLAADATEN